MLLKKIMNSEKVELGKSLWRPQNVATLSHQLGRKKERKGTKKMQREMTGLGKREKEIG